MIPIFHAAGHMAYARSIRRYAMCRLQPVMDHRQFQKLSTEGYFTVYAFRQTLERQVHRPDNRQWAALVSRGWAKASACRLQVSLYCVLSSARSYVSRICPCRLSTLWLVSLVVFSCHMVYKWWHAVDVPCLGPFYLSRFADYIY